MAEVDCPACGEGKLSLAQGECSRCHHRCSKTTLAELLLYRFVRDELVKKGEMDRTDVVCAIGNLAAGWFVQSYDDLIQRRDMFLEWNETLIQVFRNKDAFAQAQERATAERATKH